MSETFEIEVPLDVDGFADLQCPHCSERFRLRPDDYSSDEIPHIFCPSCGLPQDIHYSDEIMDYAESIAAAGVEKSLARELGLFGHTTFCSRQTDEPPVPADATLQDREFPCCGRHAKLNPLTAFVDPFCPYCGDRQMNNLELKRTIREFRLRASQLANADWRTYGSALAAFLAYVRSVPCLVDFIRSCGPCSRDWNEVLNKESDLWQSEESDFSADPKVRTAELFSFLEFLLDNKVDIVGFSFRYDISADCPGAIRAFHRAVPGMLMEELELFLQSLADESGEPSKQSVTAPININNAGQVNVASGHATIHATQTTASPEIADLLKKLDELLESAKREMPAAQDDLQNCVEETKKQLCEGTTWKRAKKLFLAIKGSICESAVLAKAAMDIMSFAQMVLPS